MVVCGLGGGRLRGLEAILVLATLRLPWAGQLSVLISDPDIKGKAEAQPLCKGLVRVVNLEGP